MATKTKNVWVLILFLLSGLVIGGVIGELAQNVDWLWWLSYNQSFGLSNPITLDLSIVNLTFAFMFKINIASILGLFIAVFVYKKI